MCLWLWCIKHVSSSVMMFIFLPSSEWHLPQHTAVFIVSFEFANELLLIMVYVSKSRELYLPLSGTRNDTC